MKAERDFLKNLQVIAERAKTRISDGTRWIDGVAEAEFKRALTPEVALDLIALCQIPRRKHPKQEPRKPITVADIWPPHLVLEHQDIRAHIEARLKKLQE